MARISVVVLMTCLVGVAATAVADWRADVGYDALVAELGSVTPDGTGISVSQVEADNDSGDYAPDTSHSEFSGKSFTLKSGSSGASSHATTVGRHLYGNTTSMAPGVTQIDAWEAGDWLGSGFLRTGGNSEPVAESRDVQNHSWIGSYADDEDNSLAIDALRRFDYTINRDNYFAAVGLNNGSGTQVPDLLGHAYNAIAVGRSDGGHSRGGTLFDVAGRVKPDIVSPLSATSWATPTVGGAAAMMLEVGDGMSGNATQPETIKAVLMAGATKQEFAWARTHARPLDDVYGAGELNVHRSYHVMSGGEQTAGTTGAALRGWDFANTSGVATYYFSVPSGQTIEEISAVLTWNRVITDGKGSPILWGDPQSSVADMDLELWSASGTTLTDRIDYSQSGVDNVEHVHWGYLDGGDYALRVLGDGTSTDYALAWYSPDPIATPASESHRWVAEATSGDWADPLNWLTAGNPAPDWDAQVANDYSTQVRTALVSADSTVRTVDISGASGEMTVEIQSGVTLTASSGVTVSTGGQVQADGQLTAPSVQVNSGRLTGDGTVDGSVTNAGTLAPGTGVGSLNVTGDYQQAAGGVLTVEIVDATGAGSGHDFLDVAGQASLDGDLQLDPGSFRPSHGTAFDLLTGAGLSGIFARIEGVSVDTDLSMAVTYTDDSVRAIAALPADADLDGDVDIVELGGDGISDFNILISNVGTGRTWVEGDFDGDGDVDIVESGGTSDFNTLISNVGASPDLGDDNAAGTGDVELVYDVTTGEVYLENAGGFEFVAFGSDGNVLPDGEDADGLNGAMSAFKDSDAVLYSGVAGNTTEDSVGLMLVTDLEAAEIGVFGQNSGEDAVDGVVTVIPEPATMSLLALGGVAALIRRKRR